MLTKEFMKNSSKTKLRIGLVFDDSLDSNDGVQQYVRTLGRWLIEQGHHVKFLVGETNNAHELQPHVYSLSRNIRVSGNQNKMFIPFFSKARDIQKVLDAEDFDILHIMMPFNPFMGSRVIRRANHSAVVASFHMVGGTWFINTGARLLAILQRPTLKKIDRFLSVSQAAQKFEKDHFGIDSTISPNMVDVRPFASGKPKKFLRGEKGTIVFLGRLVERKGAAHLLNALRRLHGQGRLSGVLVHICGDGELRAELEEFVRDHNLDNNVIFHGFIDESEKADYLASADIAIYPSTGGEAFGIVLIEAMATGRCVVLGGDNAGYRTVLGERPDQLFDPHNEVELAQKIDHYLRSELARKQSCNWQAKAVMQYHVSYVGEKLVEIYKRTIHEKHTN